MISYFPKGRSEEDVLDRLGELDEDEVEATRSGHEEECATSLQGGKVISTCAESGEEESTDLGESRGHRRGSLSGVNRNFGELEVHSSEAED